MNLSDYYIEIIEVLMYRLHLFVWRYYRNITKTTWMCHIHLNGHEILRYCGVDSTQPGYRPHCISSAICTFTTNRINSAEIFKYFKIEKLMIDNTDDIYGINGIDDDVYRVSIKRRQLLIPNELVYWFDNEHRSKSMSISIHEEFIKVHASTVFPPPRNFGGKWQ